LIESLVAYCELHQQTHVRKGQNGEAGEQDGHMNMVNPEKNERRQPYRPYFNSKTLGFLSTINAGIKKKAVRGQDDSDGVTMLSTSFQSGHDAWKEKALRPCSSVWVNMREMVPCPPTINRHGKNLPLGPLSSQ
jgi:hypothetical protein